MRGKTPVCGRTAGSVAPKIAESVDAEVRVKTEPGGGPHPPVEDRGAERVKH